MRLAAGWGLGASVHARFESSEALAELPVVERTAVELHGCCARVSLAAALLSQHIDGVARAGSAGTKSRSRARSLVLLTMLAPSSRTARLRDQLGLDDEANSEIADGYATGSSGARVTSVGGLPTSSVSADRGPADPRESVFWADTPRDTPFFEALHPGGYTQFRDG